jgi:hypothetical protein
MWNTLFPAIMPLVGVIVGAVTTTGTNYVLAVRKEKAEEALVARKEATEAAKDKVARTNELKVAARLISNELYAAYVSALTTIERKQYVHGEVARNYPLDAWRDGKGILARELPYDAYQAVEFATRCIDHFRASSTDVRLSKEIDDAEIESVTSICGDIKAGLDALKQYI